MRTKQKHKIKKLLKKDYDEYVLRLSGGEEVNINKDYENAKN